MGRYYFLQFRADDGSSTPTDDAVRWKKIADGGAFPEKFRIDATRNFTVAAPGVSGKRPAELEPSASGTVLFSITSLGERALRRDLPPRLVMAERSASPELLAACPRK